jgi:amino acid adenylation domain-containing protein
VSDHREQLSYRALMERSDRLACRLKASGVLPENRVGLMLERSTDLVVSILAIWSVGAAYVPLDPGFPLDRLSYIAEDADLAAVISESSLQHLWPSGSIVIALDQASWQLDSSFIPVDGPVAYLLYTSGSTGKPKGVRVGQHSVLNFLHAMQTLLQFDRDTRLLAITTPAFDISVLELLLPLLSGGTVVVCDRDTTMDGVKLSRRLRAEYINVLQATPASWKMLTDAGWDGISDLTALCGGEPLPPSLAEVLLQRTGALWNVYGPTETTVWSTAARVNPNEPIHLGQPIGNTQLYVLDEHQRMVPPGVLGELWIGGDGLAIDYWNRPELTAKQFTTLETLPEAGRLYRTGDRVRWTSDGRLEHHGRLDFQVKVRGYRIELGEIETVLRQQAGITDAVAIVREDRPGDTRLVAYLIGTSTPTALSAALREVLPAYMVPSAFVFMDQFPQTPNRKIDRKALPAPDQTVASETFVAPRDATEINLANAFAKLLGLPQVGIHDDFFAIGGHSLLAVQLMAEINRLFGVELPVSTLIQHGTVAQLAARLRGETSSESSMLLTLRPGKEVQPLWLFHPIGGNVFCYLELTRNLHADRPVLAFQAPGLDSDGEAEVTVEAMARRYLEQLRQHQPSGPYLLGGWCFGGVIAFEAARQLRDAGEMVTGLALIDTRAPIEANVPSDSDDATLLSWFARDLATPFGKTLKIEPDALRALPAEQMFEHVLTQAKAIEVIPADADSAQLQRYFEVYIANGIALQTYFPPVDDLPVMLVRAIDEEEDFGPHLGWDQLTPNSLTQVELPGNHNSIMYSPQATAVAGAIDCHFSITPLPGFSS